jgi:hypothetical protein
MSALVESLLQYIRQSERLVVVTLTLTIAGLVLFAAERGQVFDFRGLPGWARPAAEGVWTVCAVHVAIRTVMGLWSWATAASRFIAGVPQRRRRAAYEQPLIQRLLATEGVEREMLCYALFRDENHIWVPGDGSRRRWLVGLLQKGLVELSDAQWGTTHYRIHRVAWAYMQNHPNKFQNLVGWPKEPWKVQEDKLEEIIREAKQSRA